MNREPYHRQPSFNYQRSQAIPVSALNNQMKKPEYPLGKAPHFSTPTPFETRRQRETNRVIEGPPLVDFSDLPQNSFCSCSSHSGPGCVLF